MRISLLVGKSDYHYPPRPAFLKLLKLLERRLGSTPNSKTRFMVARRTIVAHWNTFDRCFRQAVRQ